ncbi:hypothetical protein ACUNV4_16235 [Granulosicoccus sp. 3-233]|uniref:hypothetical protein n=1 Tax=Granulosicoccus sp. 3-233 TaxID=3417969 RepID=UPI003D34058E
MDRRTPELLDAGGLWRRRWLRTPECEDSTSHVLWMQGEQMHVDLRLPAAAKAFRHAPSLSALDAGQLRLLARAEGFAGRTTLVDGVCTWRRHINFQGPLKGIDTGKILQTPEGLREIGIHAPCEALWESVDTTLPQARQMSNSQGQTLVILWTATRFAMGRGWHERTIHTRSLLEHVNYALSCGNHSVLARAFDQEFCFGRMEDEQGVIEHSTQPMRCGKKAFDAAPLFTRAARIRVQISDFHGQVREEEFRVERRSVAMA